MPKPRTYLPILDELISFSISTIKSTLKSFSNKTISVSWTDSVDYTTTMDIEVNSVEPDMYIGFDYFINDEEYRYKVEVRKIRGNLVGGGFEWAFVCRSTGKLCKRLFLDGGYFVSRGAVKNTMYYSQARSKGLRDEIKDQKEYKRLMSIIMSGQEIGFRHTFKGRPTKKYLEIQEACAKLKEMADRDERELAALLVRPVGYLPGHL
jgi:hypothetical protein